MPGYETMIESLLRRTSDIAQGAALASASGDGMLGHNTAAAIELGATQALAALAVRTVEWVEHELGRRPRVFLGGGDASRIVPLLSIPVEVSPELVLEGLAVIAEGS